MFDSVVGDRPRVLLVDDLADTADLLALVLEDLGFCAACAYDGEQGLSLVEQLHPATVILDIDMPGMGGLELCRRIRSTPQGKTIRIIVMSGWTRPSDLAAARDAGCDAYLMKPSSLAAVMQAMRGENAESRPVWRTGIQTQMLNGNPDRRSRERALLRPSEVRACRF